MTQLNNSEMFSAAMTGVRRRLNSMIQDRKAKYGEPKQELWGLDIESCASELLVAKHLGLYWYQSADRPQDDGGDVGPCEVRWTKHTTGKLIVREQDKDNAPFILVTAPMPNMQIRGWLMGLEAKYDRYWKSYDGRSAFFVPQEDLNPMDTLKSKLFDLATEEAGE